MSVCVLSLNNIHALCAYIRAHTVYSCMHAFTYTSLYLSAGYVCVYVCEYVLVSGCLFDCKCILTCACVCMCNLSLTLGGGGGGGGGGSEVLLLLFGIVTEPIWLWFLL